MGSKTAWASVLGGPSHESASGLTVMCAQRREDHALTEEGSRATDESGK